LGRPTLRWLATGLVPVVVLVATVVGCSDDESRGTDNRESTVEDFCSALATFRDEKEAADSTDLAAYIRALKAAAEEIDEVGVPEDMPNDAEQGFDLTIARIQGLADDATQEDVAQLGDVTDEEQRQLDALEAYIKKACPEVVDPS
jgi:hypothetical protein